MPIDIKKIKDVGEQSANLVTMFKTYLEKEQTQTDIENELIKVAESGKTTAKIFIGLTKYNTGSNRSDLVILRFQISGKPMHDILTDIESARHSCRNNWGNLCSVFTTMLDNIGASYKELEQRNPNMKDWKANSESPLFTYMISLIKEE